MCWDRETPTLPSLYGEAGKKTTFHSWCSTSVCVLRIRCMFAGLAANIFVCLYIFSGHYFKKLLLVVFGNFIHVCNTFCLFSTFHPFLPPLPWVSALLLPMSPFQRCLISSWPHPSLFLIIIGSHGQPPFTGKRNFSY